MLGLKLIHFSKRDHRAINEKHKSSRYLIYCLYMQYSFMQYSLLLWGLKWRHFVDYIVKYIFFREELNIWEGKITELVPASPVNNNVAFNRHRAIAWTIDNLVPRHPQASLVPNVLNHFCCLISSCHWWCGHGVARQCSTNTHSMSKHSHPLSHTQAYIFDGYI